MIVFGQATSPEPPDPRRRRHLRRIRVPNRQLRADAGSGAKAKADGCHSLHLSLQHDLVFGQAARASRAPLYFARRRPRPSTPMGRASWTRRTHCARWRATASARPSCARPWSIVTAAGQLQRALRSLARKLYFPNTKTGAACSTSRTSPAHRADRPQRRVRARSIQRRSAPLGERSRPSDLPLPWKKHALFPNSCPAGGAGAGAAWFGALSATWPTTRPCRIFPEMPALLFEAFDAQAKKW